MVIGLDGWKAAGAHWNGARASVGGTGPRVGGRPPAALAGI